MSENVKKAKELLQKANKEFTELCKKIAVEQPLDSDAPQIYLTTAELNVLTSQLVDKGEQRFVEGQVEVNNVQAMISIGEMEIRDNIEFELLCDGKWIKGERQNSQYGQMFMGEGVSGHILTEHDKGRVALPLRKHSNTTH